VIGYYVHHQGSGHLHRMLSFAEHVRVPLTVLSSLPAAHRALAWVHLADDALGPSPVDADAHGTLHWVPRHDAGLRARTMQVVTWLEREQPGLVVVDVSVEIATLVRLAGVPVVVMAMPGERDDRAHRLAYDLADAVIAPWPRGLGVEAWPPEWTAKTTFVGGVGRFDGRPRLRPVDDGGHPRGLLLWGRGGDTPVDRRLAELRQATPGWTWEAAGPGHPMSGAQVWQALCRCDVVVSHAGQNAVAELAAARAHAVVVADDRPFDEQRHMARALDASGLAVGLDDWPPAEEWPRLLALAGTRGGGDWARWSDGCGARRLARTVEALVRQLAPQAPSQPVDA
jgi:Glycosyltransferase family 28 C-terminal domain